MSMREGRLGNILLPLGTTVLFLVIWHHGVSWFDVPSYLIPTPLSVLLALKRGLLDGVLWPHIWATTAALLIGYVVGCASAILLAVLVSESSFLERAFYPLIVAFQSVPKVALAPIIIVWFGFELESKVVMVALICFFPCFVNALVGLKSCNPNLIDLYRAFGASRMQILFSVKLPSATSSIFAGLEISIVMALLGAVMSELVASSRGLGHVIEASSVDFNVAMMFACVIILAAIGVIASQIILAVHRRVAFWDRRVTTSITAP
jgi:NitT/TauT family transport system permease protein